MMITNLRIIGDVHGQCELYRRLLRKARFTIQVGDFGFDYSTLVTVDSKQHRILGGNHDDYDKIGKCPHYLGDYGVYNVPRFGDLFFVRGGLSIDRHERTEGFDWWKEEELDMSQCYSAIKEYSRIKPDFMITHVCPATIVTHVTESSYIIPSRTTQLLEQMFAIHQPKTWVFGHYHRSWAKAIDGTKFICLNELECLDIA